MITVDHSRDSMLTDHAVSLLQKHYLRDGETPQDGFARAATAWSGGDAALAQRIYDAASKGWFMFASPVLSNAPAPGETLVAQPISCFLNYVPDSIKGLNDHTVETRWLAVAGGGVGGHWSSVRSVSQKSPGPIPFIKTMDADMGAFLQGTTRRGSYAAHLDVSHPDIEEFITLRTPTGDDKRKCLGAGFHHAVNITDKFMRAVVSDAEWPLVDPHDGSERNPMTNGGRRLRARHLWETILETRYRSGEPYLCFIDAANRGLPQPLKDKGLRINGSNLCQEVMEATAPNRTAVCCLSSLNLEKIDEWRDTRLVEDLITMLDNVLQHFIDTAGDDFKNAVYSATQERSIGLGYMGWHALLQQKNLPVESHEALRFSTDIYRMIYQRAVAQSLVLGTERGEAPDMVGTGRRNALLIAVAPNANSATILATSPSIEVAKANAYTHRTRAGSHLVKNRYLEDLLRAKGLDNDDIWQSVILNRGSIQHLDCLTDHEKRVFRTAIEVEQRWIVDHAAARQHFIDQGQSVNLFFPPNASRDYINNVHIQAWHSGLKSLYYLRTEVSTATDSVGKKIERDKLRDVGEDVQVADDQSCVACEA